MTNKEALKILPDMKGAGDDWDKAIDLAVEALKVQHDWVEQIVNRLKNDPEVEWVEIVRCGQCKYAEVADAQDNQDGYTCQFHRGSIWFSGSYCSWGERRTDD